MIFELGWSHTVVPIPIRPEYQKKSQAIVRRFDRKKVIYETCFSNRAYSSSDSSCELFSFETLKFRKFRMALKLYAKNMKILTKIRSPEKFYKI